MRSISYVPTPKVGDELTLISYVPNLTYRSLLMEDKMAKLFVRSRIVVVRDDEEARSRNWVSDQEDFYVRSLGRGLWSVRAIFDDGSFGRPCHFRTAEFERTFLRCPETFVKVYKIRRMVGSH